MVDHVERAHGETSAVGDNADGSVETHILQALRMGSFFAFVTNLRGFVLVPFVTVLSVVVESDLGVECMHLAVGLHDERVDLCKIGVAIGVGGVELEKQRNRTVGNRRVEVGSKYPIATHRFGEAIDRVDPDLGDRVGVLDSDLFDLDAAFLRKHAEMLLGRAVECERHVVLLGDVRGDLDPDDASDVSGDIESEDVACVLTDFIGVVGEFDATRLSATTGMHLGLDDDGIAHCLGSGNGLVDGRYRTPVGHRNAELGEELFALIFE